MSTPTIRIEIDPESLAPLLAKIMNREQQEPSKSEQQTAKLTALLKDHQVPFLAVMHHFLEDVQMAMDDDKDKRDMTAGMRYETMEGARDTLRAWLEEQKERPDEITLESTIPATRAAMARTLLTDMELETKLLHLPRLFYNVGVLRAMALMDMAATIKHAQALDAKSQNEAQDRVKAQDRGWDVALFVYKDESWSLYGMAHAHDYAAAEANQDVLVRACVKDGFAHSKAVIVRAGDEVKPPLGNPSEGR